MKDSGSERRKTKRLDILEVFSFYICVPSLGLTRHKVDDVSEMGIGFTLDTLGEIKLANGQSCELQFYINQSLFFPLKIQVVRAFEEGEKQRIGAVFLETKSKGYQTFLTLVNLVDQLSDVGQLSH